VIVRRAFGVAGGAFVDRGDPDIRVSWPSGDWGSLPLEGGIEAAYKKKLQSASDPLHLRRQLLHQFEHVRSPIRTAHAFGIEVSLSLSLSLSLPTFLLASLCL